MARQETYYLRNGQPMLVRIARWWDVEGDRAAPEPGREQDWYIENGEAFQRIIKVQSQPPRTHIERSPRPAANLGERSRMIAGILLGTRSGEAATKPLEALPEADP